LLSIGSGDGDIQDGSDRAPKVNESLVRRLIGGRVDELDVGRQRNRDADQPVFHQVRKVRCILAVHSKVVGINRTKEGIVSVLVVGQPGEEGLEARLYGRRGELEAFGGHVTIGA
jgi:hypothetical protein